MCRVGRGIARLHPDAHLAVPQRGVLRVEAELHQAGFQHVGIHIRGRRVGRWYDRDLHARVEQIAQQVLQPVEEAAEGQAHGVEARAARGGEQLLHGGGSPARGPAAEVECGHPILRRVEHLEQFEMAEDDGQLVVEVMRHAADELVQRAGLLGVGVLLLRFAQLCLLPRVGHQRDDDIGRQGAVRDEDQRGLLPTARQRQGNRRGRPEDRQQKAYVDGNDRTVPLTPVQQVDRVADQCDCGGKNHAGAGGIGQDPDRQRQEDQAGDGIGRKHDRDVEQRCAHIPPRKQCHDRQFRAGVCNEPEDHERVGPGDIIGGGAYADEQDAQQRVGPRSVLGPANLLEPVVVCWRSHSVHPARPDLRQAPETGCHHRRAETIALWTSGWYCPAARSHAYRAGAFGLRQPAAVISGWSDRHRSRCLPASPRSG